VALVTLDHDGRWVAGENAIRNHAGRVIPTAGPSVRR
jgi:hypothetical protein